MPSKSIQVHRLPGEVDAAQFAGSTAVVVDILRATSSMTTALASGADAVVPFSEIEAARDFHREFGEPSKLCGERNWAMIPGFHLGNSPVDYSQNASGQTFIFTTTNGTRALHHAKKANKIYLGTFLNLSTLEQRLAQEVNVQILCSGTKGEPSWEDQLFAGALADRIAGDNCQLNEIALEVISTWRDFVEKQSNPRDLFQSLCSGTGGSNLVKRGLESDIEYCAQIDVFNVVAEFFPNENVIRLSDSDC